MKKITAVVSLAVMLLFLPTIADAQKIKGTSPEEFVKHYVELGKAKDYETIVDLIVDDRFMNEDHQTKVDTYRTLQEDLPALENYEIKEVKEATEGKAIVLTLLEYEDGSIEQVPMQLIKEKGEWKLELGSEDATADEDFEQIKQPDITDEIKSEDSSENPPIATVFRGPSTMSFDYWGRAGGTTFYSIAEFDTKVKNSFSLVATQTHEYLDSTSRVRVNYAIVKPGGLFTKDKVWGSAYKTGSYMPSPFEGTIPKASGSPRYTNAKMRFQTEEGFTHSMGYKGTGVLYEY